MALDFSNRNPQDPSGIYSLDVTNAADVWVKDDDWSKVYYDQAEARKAGATNKVRLATAVTNDGRKFDVVVGADGRPISQIGDSTGQDDDIARKFKEAQAAANKPPEERNNNGRRERWNPSTSRWEDVGPAINTGSATQTDAPPGGKPFIDDGPEAGQHGRRWGWNPATKAYDRDLGPSPAAQKPPDPQDRVGKPTGNTRTRSENGTTVKETEYLLPDGSKEWRSQTETTQPDRVGKPTGNTRERTENGQAIKEAEYVLPDGTKEWRSQTAPEKDYQPPLPAGVPRFVPDPDQDDYGLAAYNDQLHDLRRRGLLTYQQGQELITQAGNQAKIAESRAVRRESNASTQRSQDITQRGQDIGAVASRRGAAGTAYGQALGLYTGAQGMAGEGNLATEAFLSALNLAQSNARQWGGLEDVPQVAPSMMQATRGADPGRAATQIVAHPDGRIEVSPAGAPPPPAEMPSPVFRPPPPVEGSVAAPSPVNPPAGEAGNDPTRPVGMSPGDPYRAALRPAPPAVPTFTPDLAALRAQFPDATDDEIEEALQGFAA